MTVDAFVEEARRYCDFVEQAGQLSLRERLAEARRRVLALYTTGSELPDVEPPDGVDAGPTHERPPIGFERFDVYREVYDPYEDGDPVCGLLSDDLLDIYIDVKRGLALWDRSQLAAIWEWRFHFDAHWGDHAVDALRALHRACRDA